MILSANTIREKDVVKALREKHSGRLTTTTKRDILATLLQSMGVRTGRKGLLVERLEAMAEYGNIELRYEEGRVVLIALPGWNEESANEQGELVSVIQIKNPTAHRDDRGPSRLADDQVSSVTVRHEVQGAEEETRALGDLVYQELCKAARERFNYKEIVETVKAVLSNFFDSPAVVSAMTDSVKTHVIDAYFNRVENGNSRVTLYEFKRQAAKPGVDAPKTHEEAIEQLMAALRKKKQRVLELEEEIEKLKAELHTATNVVSAEDLEALLKKLETLRQEKQQLDQKLEEAGAQKARADKAHTSEITRLKKSHLETVQKLQKELAEAVEAREAAEQKLEEAPKKALLPTALAEQLRRELKDE